MGLVTITAATPRAPLPHAISTAVRCDAPLSLSVSVSISASASAAASASASVSLPPSIATRSRPRRPRALRAGRRRPAPCGSAIPRHCVTLPLVYSPQVEGSPEGHAPRDQAAKGPRFRGCRHRTVAFRGDMLPKGRLSWCGFANGHVTVGTLPVVTLPVVTVTLPVVTLPVVTLPGTSRP